MSQKNQYSWNKKWQAQMDKAHSELLEMLEAKLAAERFLEKLDLEMRIQLAMMELIDSQIKPKAPE